MEQTNKHPELEAISQNLSIAVFRYVPVPDLNKENQATYLNTLNETLLNELQKKGEMFLSNAVVNGHYCLRCCVVNFRTAGNDIDAVIEISQGRPEGTPATAETTGYRNKTRH